MAVMAGGCRGGDGRWCGLVCHSSVTMQAVMFAVLTIVDHLGGAALLSPRHPGRRYQRHALPPGRPGRRGGQAIFRTAAGRVFVDGKEWAAQLEGGASLASGDKVIVVAVGGARLTVRPG